MEGACHAWGPSEMHTKFSSENMIERDLEESNIDRRIILKSFLRKYNVDWIQLDLDRDKDWIL